MTPTSAAACTWDGTSAMRAVELELGLLGAGSCPASNKGAKGCARASGTALYAHPCLQHDDLRNVSSPQECYDERPPAPSRPDHLQDPSTRSNSMHVRRHYIAGSWSTFNRP